MQCREVFPRFVVLQNTLVAEAEVRVDRLLIFDRERARTVALEQLCGTIFN